MVILGRVAYLQLGAAGHHLGEGNTDTLNDSQQNSTTNGTISGSLVASSNGQRATGKETCDNGVVWILLLADALDGAVKGGEQATPYAKVSTENGCSHLDGRDGAYSPFAVGRVSVAFDAVPYRTADGLFARSVSRVSERARVCGRCRMTEERGEESVHPCRKRHQSRSG